jgi:hypothetical protein
MNGEKVEVSVAPNCRDGHTLVLMSQDDLRSRTFRSSAKTKKDGLEATYRQTGDAECPHCRVAMLKYDTPRQGACMVYCSRCSTDVVRT